MIKIENTEVLGWGHAIHGMRNPMNSWGKSDSVYFPPFNCTTSSELILDGKHTYTDPAFILGENDLDLMRRLAKAGTDHAKFRRMIVVYADLTAPLYWWKEFDTYKVGTVANSCSTMHKIADKEFVLDDFSHENLFRNPSLEIKIEDLNKPIAISSDVLLYLTVQALNAYRSMYLNESDPEMKKLYWWQMIQLLPSSYNQKRTVMLNYEVLANIYKSRKDHKLDEWREFCTWIEKLPYSEIITLKEG